MKLKVRIKRVIGWLMIFNILPFVSVVVDWRNPLYTHLQSYFIGWAANFGLAVFGALIVVGIALVKTPDL